MLLNNYFNNDIKILTHVYFKKYLDFSIFTLQKYQLDSIVY